MSEYVNFHYMPLEGKITGEQVLKQTEDAINDLGNKVYNLDIDQSEIDEAIEKSNEAINTANSALAAVTTGRSVWFNNVAEMVATDIEAGVTAETKGYYVANDGGNALYLIRQEKSGDVVDGGSLIALDNGNMAELVTDGTVNVKQFGAIGNGTDDDTTAFQNTSSYAQSNGFVPFVGVATYKIANSVTGTFNSFGEVTITGGGTVDIINLQEVVSDVSDIRDEVVDKTASAKAYSESAATSATNASNSASSASSTATQLMAYLEDKETLTAPAVDPTLTISGAAADAKVTGDAVSDLNQALDNLFTYSPNLYNVKTNTVGKNIDSSGNIVDRAAYSITDFIYLEPGNYWVSKYATGVQGFSYVAYYKLDKTFNTSKGRPEVSSNNLTISSACYVRFTGATNSINVAMLIKGSTAPTEYIPYYNDLNGNIQFENVRNVSVGIEETNFISTSENLINRMLVTEGKVISAQGVISDNANYAITDKTRLKPSTVYSYGKCFRIVYFNEGNTTPVSQASLGERGSEYLNGTFTTPDRFDYAIIAMYMSDIYKKQWQVVEGGTLPTYEPQHLIIDGYPVFEPEVKPDPISAIKAWDKIVTDTAPVYTLDSEVSAIGNADKNCAAIYAKYDALMAQYPTYITKTQLGSNGDPINPVMLYRYDIKQPHAYSTNPKVKIIMISGVHPEYAGIYALYYAIEKLLSDPALIDLKHQLHIICMPVVNAYGVNNGVRKNYNGIDLARNFEVDFVPGTDPSSESYSGTTALSEVEDQYVNQLMENNLDAVFFVSCHNFQSAHPATGVTKDNYNMWGCGSSKYTINVSGKVIDKMTEAWKNKYLYADESFGYATLGAPAGSEGLQCLKYGIQGMTFEVGAYFKAESPDVYSAFCISRDTEVYVNLMRTVAYCFSYCDKVHQFE